MEQMWKRLMAVLGLSILLPHSVIWFGSKYFAGKPQPLPTQPPQTVLPTTQQTDETKTGSEYVIMIPVLVSENLVVRMELEAYVRGVVLAEMPASFDSEALKAQAVAARTYAMRRVTLGDRHSEGAVCTDSTCCQAWISEEGYLDSLGVQQDLQRVDAAVTETAGLVVTYAGALAETTYFSCSGGRTESALSVWDAAIPYLQAVDSPGEEWASAFSREQYFTAEEFSACLGRKLAGTPESWLGSLSRTDGGGVATLVIGGISYPGRELRSLLGLPSTCFVMTADGDGILVTSWGHGHRVGMSQYGADAMADEGCDFRQILGHYYPGTEIDKIGELG